ncbi:MAG TPA: DegT/DnrJ/EryC1/StrS family aminotransferase [Cyclobacteriaceae bacterium]|nr:DegT/DnrJ/EryC1/StrS family aminotransferase [Cyclobacteriaceae bacterium]
MTPIRIPLSTTPFDAHGLTSVLEQYAREPQAIILRDFESGLRQLTGARYALALSSGTAGIHLALKASGVGVGDIVLVSSFTYVASVNPILYLGAVPAFVDSEETTWNMDPSLLEQSITDFLKKNIVPKAILVVHAYGMPARMNEILGIGNKYGIVVIEDAAEALGSEIDGRKLGTLGTTGIFSFNNNKIMTTYGGGALITNDQMVFDNALRWANQSRENKSHYEHKELGYNYRMGPLAAAQGILGLRTLDNKLKARRSIHEKYRNGLRDAPVSFVDEPSGFVSNRWLSTIRLKTLKIPHIQAEMVQAGIETRQLWKPMDEQPVFQGFPSCSRGISANLFETGLTLPSSEHLAAEDMQSVISVITNSITGS